jgi:hypothetical protein
MRHSVRLTSLLVFVALMAVGCTTGPANPQQLPASPAPPASSISAQTITNACAGAPKAFHTGAPALHPAAATVKKQAIASLTPGGSPVATIATGTVVIICWRDNVPDCTNLDKTVVSDGVALLDMPGVSWYIGHSPVGYVWVSPTDLELSLT